MAVDRKTSQSATIRDRNGGPNALEGDGRVIEEREDAFGRVLQ